MMKKQLKKLTALTAVFVLASLNFAFVSCPPENPLETVYLPHESDCSKFYLCSSGMAIEMTCSSGLVFNPSLNICDWPFNVGCTGSGGGGYGPYVEDYYNKSEIVYEITTYIDTALKRFGLTIRLTGGGSSLVTYCEPEPWYRFNDKCYTALNGVKKIM